MRRNYISPEFIYNNVNGTYNMLEQSSFFGSKMIKIMDNLMVSNEDINYYQLSSNEQINLLSENTLVPIIFNASSSKRKNHQIVTDSTQSIAQFENNTRWVITINIKKILTEYIFALLKKNRTFEGVYNSTTVFNDVNAAMTDYITKNILNRYQFSNISFYISYVDIKSDNRLRYNVNFNDAIISPTNLFTKVNSSVDVNQEILTVVFVQEKNSALYSFDYYFDLLFTKI